MIFTRLRLTNFGIFRGDNELDLYPRTEAGDPRPVVLVGGRNGSGKTTILEAIRLCLYGRRGLGSRTSQVEYERYLGGRFHRGGLGGFPASRASVAIDLEYANAGIRASYSLERRWERRRDRIEETFLLKRNGDLLHEIGQSQWQDFVMDLVPPSFSHLFFFDGEKVQALAEGENEQGELRDSLKALLGLDLVEQLNDDLSTYLSRHEGANGQDHLIAQRADLQARKDETIGESQKLYQSRAAIQTQLDARRKQLDDQERLISRQGGSFARKREKLRRIIDRLAHKRSAAERSIEALCAGLLPFALAPGLASELRERLRKEYALQQVAAAHAVVNERLRALNARFDDDSFWSADGAEVPSPVRQLLRSRIAALLRDGLVQPTAKEDAIVHGLSLNDSRRLEVWIDQALGDVAKQAMRVGSNLQRITDRQSHLEDLLRKAPDDDTIKPLLDELGRLHESISSLLADHRKHSELIQHRESQITQLDRDLRHLDSDIRKREQLSEKVRLAADVRLALAEFQSELTAAKMEQLRVAIGDCFNRLMHKEGFVGDVQIDPQTLQIGLLDPSGHPLPKSHLSAGERQIYAVATLWALSQVSGRVLPIIIDTPLGRLDGDHRHAIVTQYLPYASQQVILLSTDTEIDEQLFVELEPVIARTYRLDYDENTRMVHCRSGYFWEAKGGAGDYEAPEMEPAALEQRADL